MNILQSIRFRIITACIVFAVLVNLSYSQLIVLFAEQSEDDVFNWHIAETVFNWSKEISTDDSLVRNLNALGQHAFIGTQSQLIIYLSDQYRIPSVDSDSDHNLKSWAYIDHIDDESHRDVLVYEFVNKEIRLHIAEASLGGGKQFVYYLVDLNDFNVEHRKGDWDSFYLQLFHFLITILLAVVIGVYLTKKAVSPLTELSYEVDNARVDQKLILKKEYYADEVGILANRISAMFLRIADFVGREKAFARDASHELRTPVTSIQMAVELIKIMPEYEGDKFRTVFDRIDRSTNDMAHLIETFLLLGREESKEEPLTQCYLKEMTQYSLKNNSYIINGKSIEIRNSIDTSVTVFQSKQILSIVIDNLIRNAFQYTDNGLINVSGCSEYIEVEDTGIGFLPKNTHKAYDPQGDSGFGLGLNIVQRICDLKGWVLNIESQQEKGSKIRVVF